MTTKLIRFSHNVGTIYRGFFDRKLLALYFNYKFLSSSFDGQNGHELKLKHFE